VFRDLKCPDQQNHRVAFKPCVDYTDIGGLYIPGSIS
jgi:hypothetical protein